MEGPVHSAVWPVGSLRPPDLSRGCAWNLQEPGRGIVACSQRRGSIHRPVETI